jgi:transposase
MIKEVVMDVMIGIDPHKASHTAVVVNETETELAHTKVRASRVQVAQLLAWAGDYPSRTWAVEGAEGTGFLLAQQLVAAGEAVLDVPATLAARTRVLATGRSNKNDPNDALSVAITALRHRSLRRVVSVGDAEVLRLLSKRNTDLASQRCRVVCRLHAILAELSPGGIERAITVGKVEQFLTTVHPATAIEQVRYDLARELVDDIRRLDEQAKRSRDRIDLAVKASATTLTELFGIGPIIAATLIGHSGDIGRFRNRDHYAAYNGTAPVEFSSGGRIVHRLSQRGNRKLNHAIHMAAVTQLRFTGSEGRVYFDRRVSEGKTKREALRVLKRQISNAVYRQLVIDAHRQ